MAAGYPRLLWCLAASVRPLEVINLGLEDGSATDHQPPGQPLETESRLMEMKKKERKKTLSHTRMQSCSLRGCCGFRYMRRLLRDAGGGRGPASFPSSAFPRERKVILGGENTLKERWRRGSEDD